MTALVVEREALPSVVIEWLESQPKGGVILVFTEDGKIVFRRLGDIDPDMPARVQRIIERYRSALEHLAAS